MQEEGIRIQVKEKGLTGANLKYIALLSMLLDHISYVLGSGYVSSVLHCIGRLAFPLFCFLLVEGYCHTSNVWKFAARLMAFAFLSEVPFDLFRFGACMSPTGCNVMFTLLIGLLTMMVWNICCEANKSPLKLVLGALCTIPIFVLAELLKTEYGAFGVALIFVMYALRGDPIKRDISSAAILLGCNLKGAASLISLPLISLYNGERGKQNKWLFYIFYPAHFLVLYAIKSML